MTEPLIRRLTSTEESDLANSIIRFGVLAPVVYDADGRLLDGANRQRIAGYLGVPCPELTIPLTGEEADRAAVDLNLARRQLSREERNVLIRQLRAEGYTYKNVAAKVGASVGTTFNVLHADDDPATFQPRKVATVEGDNGKKYRPAADKADAVALVDEGETIRDVAARYGVNETTVGRWVKAAHDDDPDEPVERRPAPAPPANGKKRRYDATDRDPIHRGKRRYDVDRGLDRLTLTIRSAGDTAAGVDLDGLTPHKAEEWATTLRTAARKISQLASRITAQAKAQEEAAQ